MLEDTSEKQVQRWGFSPMACSVATSVHGPPKHEGCHAEASSPALPARWWLTQLQAAPATTATPTQHAPRNGSSTGPSTSGTAAASPSQPPTAANALPGPSGQAPLTMDLALSRFKAGATHFTTHIEALVQATDQERKALEEARRQLDEDRRAFEEECRRVENVLSDVEQVTLNVGGCRFTTSVSTLRNAPSPSLFNAMFSGRHKLVKDQEGCYFIDRDGRHFHDILNYLRDGVRGDTPCACTLHAWATGSLHGVAWRAPVAHVCGHAHAHAPYLGLSAAVLCPSRACA